MDTALLVVVALNLCLLSGLVAYRMRTSGASAGRIALPLAELWVAVGLWIAIFRALAGIIASPASGGPLGELAELGGRLGGLPSATRVWVLGGLMLSLAMVGHLLWSLNRAMHR